MKKTHLLTDVSRSQKQKARRLIQCAMAGAIFATGLYNTSAVADVAVSPSLYDSYNLADHPFQIVEVPDYQAAPKMEPPILFPDAPYLRAGVGTSDPAYDPNAIYGTTGLTIREALGIAGNTVGDVAISADTAPYRLEDDLGTIIVNKADDGQIILRSHNFRIRNETGGNLGIPAIDVQSGNVLFYAAESNDGYAQFPMKISGGTVRVFAFRASPQINLTEITNGSFFGNRYIRFNSSASTTLDMSELDITNGYFEIGQNNTVNQTLNLFGNSTLILNGGNVLSSGGPSPNSINGSVNIGEASGTDNAYAVFGIQNRITGDVNVNNTGTLRSLGPTEIEGDLNFANDSTFIATLGTPINAQEFHYNVNGDGYIGSIISPDPITGEPDALTPAGSLAYWNTSEGLGDWQAQYPDFAEQIFDPASTVGDIVDDYDAHFYAPPEGTYLLKVDGDISAATGSTLVLDSVTSLSVGQKYIIFKVAPSSTFTNNFSITNALPALTFSESLLNEVSTIDGYTDYYVELTGVDLSQLDLSGGNKSQISFFNYLNELNDNPPLSPNTDSSLAWIISNFNDLGPDSANSFLGNTYAAHDAQTYWNQKAFISQISDQLNNARNMSSGKSTFNLNATRLNNVNSQLFALRQSFNRSQLGALNANGNNSLSNTGIWASIYGDRVNTEGDSGLGSMGWNGSTTGFAAGYTGGGERFAWGVAAGHQKSDLDFDNLVAGAQASGELDGYNLGLYGSLNRKNSYLTGILSYGNFDNDATRTDMIGTNTSSFKSHGLAAQLEYGVHVRQTKTSDFTPYASLLWSKSDRDDITESGTGAGLSLDDSSNSVLTSQLGVRYNYRMFDKKDDSLKGGLVAGVAWQHQFGDTDFPLTARFNDDVSGNSFNSYGTPLSGNSLQVQLGAYGRIHNNVIGFANYRGTFGNNEKVHAVTAGLGYQF